MLLWLKLLSPLLLLLLMLVGSHLPHIRGMSYLLQEHSPRLMGDSSFCKSRAPGLEASFLLWVCHPAQC
jgi:hypothetical protein